MAKRNKFNIFLWIASTISLIVLVIAMWFFVAYNTGNLDIPLDQPNTSETTTKSTDSEGTTTTTTTTVGPQKEQPQPETPKTPVTPTPEQKPITPGLIDQIDDLINIKIGGLNVL